MVADNPADVTRPHVRNGEVNLGGLPKNPSITQADEVMRIVSEHLGQQWWVVKLSGWWRVFCPKLAVGWGAEPGQLTHNFAKALAQATGLPVKRDVPRDQP